MRSIFFLILMLFISSAEAKKVTVDGIECSLKGQGPINVGFDIDDTVLFSSPGFFYYLNNLCDGELKNCKDNSDFWHNINNNADNYSLPKKIGYKLIKMHQNRGDKIYFITARMASDEEKVTNLLATIFNITNMQQVIFASEDKQLEDKSKEISHNKIQIYYGDSDADMDSAKKANARPIRILRAKNSSNKQEPHIGKFGEEVVIDSEY